MSDEITGFFSPETEEVLEQKLKFSSPIAEAVDGTLIKIVDNALLSKIAKKLDPEILDAVQTAIAEVAIEMPEIEV